MKTFKQNRDVSESGLKISPLFNFPLQKFSVEQFRATMTLFCNTNSEVYLLDQCLRIEYKLENLNKALIVDYKGFSLCQPQSGWRERLKIEVTF
jgi:hypothetical protein